MGGINASDHPVSRRKNRWLDACEMYERFSAKPPFDSWDPRVLRDYCDYALHPADEEGVRQITHIDLTSADWLEGPYNFIKPNDVIIVNPNNPKVKSAGFIGNVGTVISVISILLTTVVLITK